MGLSKDFTPELLVLGVLSSPRAGDSAPLLTALFESFGPIRRQEAEMPFPWSDYYDEEMGGRPRRFFLAFSSLTDPSALAAVKVRSNEIETAFAVGGRRRYNLDPGFLALGRFVLATTKDRPHRIALGAGIYGEITLIYEKGEYRPLPWTYPDWASPAYRKLLAELREELKIELRKLNREGPLRA